MRVPVGRIAYARSGDKGGTANIGVAARHERWFVALERELTAAVVQEYFSDRARQTERFELPNLYALNFLLHGILGRGGTSTLRLDPQGKALADALCFLEIELTDTEFALLNSGADEEEHR
ncbi:hypothetical protein [Parafrankia sp. EUN1f]|uniref:AtuA-related protein n=1 Tax=Parafrankia sp. EUN1f TaxID=102897 RepID=UPI0001C4779C|nr:hypothetical protein [Parafrankia sp. EUN1f]EFC86823.1 conserved hypothetical protein [Parafrankia sp. EUN1f]